MSIADHVDDLTWHDQAACRPDQRPAHLTADAWAALWFPNERSGAIAYQQARQVCDSCPVRDTCLDQHLHETEGMWGGTSPRERLRIRRRRGDNRRPNTVPARRRVAQLVRQGLTDRAIADRLDLSIRVVRDFRVEAGFRRRADRRAS